MGRSSEAGTQGGAGGEAVLLARSSIAEAAVVRSWRQHTAVPRPPSRGLIYLSICVTPATASGPTRVAPGAGFRTDSEPCSAGRCLGLGILGAVQAPARDDDTDDLRVTVLDLQAALDLVDEGEGQP